MEQKATKELDRIHAHGGSSMAMSVVLPIEADAVVFERAKAVIGDRDAMGVASQILQHTLRSTEGRLGVHDPFDAGGLPTKCAKRGRIGEVAEFAGEVKLAIAESGPHRAQELLSKQAAQYTYGEKERFTTGDPAGAVRRETAAGHNAMQVRMEMQILTPGVEHGEEADGGSEMFGIVSRVSEAA